MGLAWSLGYATSLYAVVAVCVSVVVVLAATFTVACARRRSNFPGTFSCMIFGSYTVAIRPVLTCGVTGKRLHVASDESTGFC